MPLSKQFFEGFYSFSIQSNEISDLFSYHKPKYDDDVIECLQFGICSSRKFSSKDIPDFYT